MLPRRNCINLGIYIFFRCVTQKQTCVCGLDYESISNLQYQDGIKITLYFLKLAKIQLCRLNAY